MKQEEVRPASQVSVIAIYFMLLAFYLVAVLGFLLPIHEAVKRIEANQQKCQEQGVK